MARGLPPSATVKVIPQGEEAAALAELPFAVLDPSLEQAETFAAWGVHTLGMLAALPEKNLVARMGQEGRRLWQLARGERRISFNPSSRRSTLAEHMELDSPVELLDSLLFVVGAMLDQLIVRANARLVALAAVTITLTLDRGGTHARTVRPALPTNDKQLWIKLLHLDLEAHPPPAAVLAVALDAEPGATSKVQLGLFSPQLPEASRLDVTLARIRAVVGEENVGRAALLDTHAPEAFRIDAFRMDSVPIDAWRDEAMQRQLLQAALRAAARQLRPAESVTVTLEAQRPVQFYFRGQSYRVDRAYGPWLAGGDWWQPTLVGPRAVGHCARAPATVPCSAVAWFATGCTAAGRWRRSMTEHEYPIPLSGTPVCHPNDAYAPLPEEASLSPSRTFEVKRRLRRAARGSAFSFLKRLAAGSIDRARGRAGNAGHGHCRSQRRIRRGALPYQRQAQRRPRAYRRGGCGQELWRRGSNLRHGCRTSARRNRHA